MNEKEQQRLLANDLQLFILPANQIGQMEVLAAGHVACEIASSGVWGKCGVCVWGGIDACKVTVLNTLAFLSLWRVEGGGGGVES